MRVVSVNRLIDARYLILKIVATTIGLVLSVFVLADDSAAKPCPCPDSFMEIGDRRLYPLCAKAMENNLLVALHTGINYTSHRPMSGEHPMQIDVLCCDFPELTVVASHGAWPWVAEMVAVARKHPNVYMEFGGLAPKYIGEQGSGWEVMHRFMNTVLSDQILYATDWPVMSHERTLSEWQGLGLKPAVVEKLLSGNAKKIIG